MQPADYVPGLSVIFQALENQGFEGFRPNNGPAYEGMTFSVHPWGDYDCDCGQGAKQYDWDMGASHAVECFLKVLENRVEAKGRELFDDIDADIHEAEALSRELGIPYRGFGAHCTCDYNERRDAADLDCRPGCVTVMPNFVHKPTGLRIDWYKHAGRGTSVENGVSAQQWDRIIIDCLNEAISADPALMS